MLVFWLFLTILFFCVCNRLLITLLLLELLAFFLIFYTSLAVSPYCSSDFFLLLIFVIFVMEGVIGLSGLIMLVSFSGSDYISSSSLVNC